MARQRIVHSLDDLGDRFEILARLFLGPVGLALGKLLQPKHVIRFRMAHHAGRVTGPLGEKDRLHLGLVEFVVERAGGDGPERGGRQRERARR